ncbi:MAG: hypothetical protein IPI69_11745 [Bacteroidales bacterium]|nr:hypothetical protein [Bacteroidales bacterium]
MNRIGKLPKRLIKKPYIYRIELLDRFYKLLLNKELIFVNPDKWEDPLENFIFNAKVIRDGKPYQNPAKNFIFSQCWSYEGDSYGIWKIYTTKEDDNGVFKRHLGVRITTELENLSQISAKNLGQFWYGFVDYKWKYELDKLPKNKNIIEALKITTPDKKHLETLLIKRKSYSYENEVRLFAIPDRSIIDKKDDKLCHLIIEPNTFITSIRFDPGMEYSEFKKHKNRLINEFGFRPKQITQSTYLNKNKYIINLD